jgi:hypothetical protein
MSTAACSSELSCGKLAGGLNISAVAASTYETRYAESYFGADGIADE